jgi:hypothetical protein
MRRPIIFLYSLLFPAVWICCGLLISAFFPGTHFGTVGTAMMFIGIAALIGWLFVRRHERDLSAFEFRKIIFYCISWALLFEGHTLFSIFTQTKAGADLSTQAKCFIVLITATVDSLFVWLAFRYTGRRVIQSYLAKHRKTDSPESVVKSFKQ